MKHALKFLKYTQKEQGVQQNNAVNLGKKLVRCSEGTEEYRTKIDRTELQDVTSLHPAYVVVTLSKCVQTVLITETRKHRFQTRNSGSFIYE